MNHKLRGIWKIVGKLISSVLEGSCVLLVKAVDIALKLLLILAEPVGLDWNKLKETLNPEFDWETAVQTTLKTDTSLKEVRYISTYCLVPKLLACLHVNLKTDYNYAIKKIKCI